MRGILIKASWVPAALWGATLLYIRPYDGWGAWAAAPLLVPCVLLSALWAVAGTAVVLLDALRERRLNVPMLAATVVGSVVIGYYVVRNLLR